MRNDPSLADKPIRILVVEDKAADAELLIREVQRAGFTPKWNRVETEADFLSELANLPDLIISDYSMPHFDGLQAVALLRQRGLDTPFILISGTLGEEAAVDAMKLGADDYLLKDRTARLGPAIERVLEEQRLHKERKQAQDELQAAHAQMRQLLEHSPAVNYALQIDGKKLIPKVVSENVTVLLGFTVPETLSYEWWFGQLHPQDRDRVVASISETLALGTSRTEYRLRDKDGIYHWVEDRRRLVRDSVNQPLEIAGVWTEITERKRAEELLRSLSSEEAGRRRKRTIWDALIVLGLSGLVFGAGYEFQLFEKPFKMLLDSNKYPLADESFATLAFLSVALLVFSFRRWRESEGEIRSQKYVTDSLRVLHDESDQRVQRRTAELAKSNATLEAEKLERQRIEHALTESERRFSDMMARIELVAMMLDKQGRITYCNDYLLRLTGWQREEVLDKDWFQLFLPPDKGEQLQVVFAALLNDQPAAWHHENEIVTRSGQRRLIRWSNSVLRSPAGDIIGTASIGEDITERQRNERLALRSQRLESIGTLAGGVAHDLNNALAPILMGAEILRTDYPAESQVVNMIQSSARRGADMVRQLLSFAKGAEGERVLLRPPQLVEAIQAMMKGSFPKNIQLNVKCDPKLPMVLGDATQLHQVLLNLCVNARDAMPDGGTLIVEAHSKEVDSAYASNIPEAKPGNYVVLRVRDTGTGIPQEILDRIFEPFFTTKGPEKGTGLGLSTVMGIVKGHGGFLHVYSQPGHGSTFAIYLPANHDCGETELVRKVTVEFRGQGETIMFVDDEAALRETARAVLRRLNFKPLTATDGADGLMQAALHRNELSAIITDLHMPNLDGLSFVKTLRRMLPDIPIVVASGRLEDAVAENFKSLGVTTRLDKPFTEVELADVLKNLLESKKSK